jgi:hypothetical protein
MNNTAVRPVGYTGTVEELVWTPGLGDNVLVRAYLWGGGGGGGGNDTGAGGAGQGGAFSVTEFIINEGDAIQIAVGGNGTGGAAGRGAPGGAAGGSYVSSSPIFNTRTATPINYTDPFGNFYPATPTVPVSSGSWGSFLNTTGVWISPVSAYQFANWYQITVPTTAQYTISMAAETYASVYSPTFLPNGFLWQSRTAVGQINVSISAGTHYMYITGVNVYSVGGVGVEITGGTISYSGGRGGYSGYSGSSGAGGGGGGATVVLLNNTVVGVAGGGGGGGGGGNRGTITGQSAPGGQGLATSSNAGQNGEDKIGDGGGGGGGGGGYGGGNGGPERPGDQGALAGTGGGTYFVAGDSQVATGQNPAGAAFPYYNRDRGRGGNSGGGSATTGYAVLEFDIGGLFVYNAGQFTRAAPYVRTGDLWKSVSATYIKQNGIWEPLIGTFAPTVNYYSNLFGWNSRPGPQPPPPPVVGGMNDIF